MHQALQYLAVALLAVSVGCAAGTTAVVFTNVDMKWIDRLMPVCIVTLIMAFFTFVVTEVVW